MLALITITCKGAPNRMFSPKSYHFKWLGFAYPAAAYNSLLLTYPFNTEESTMPRSTRLIIPDQWAVYHVMFRTALDGFLFQDIDKDRMVDVIRKFSSLYFTEILDFCIMGNHFHILVRMIPDTHFTVADIKARYPRFYGNDDQISNAHLPHYRNKWSNLSEFLKEIKQSVTRDYNKRHHRRGTLRGERFKSGIVENGETLINFSGLYRPQSGSRRHRFPPRGVPVERARISYSAEQ
jgi:REP element-mobilizing transposase RayT